MDFAEKYPKSLRPARFEPPHVDIEFEPRIVWRGMFYSCTICYRVTGFYLTRLDTLPSSPCCSDECKVVAVRQEPEEDPTFIFTSPSISVVEDLLDKQEVAGSNPASGTILWEQTLLHMLGASNGIL